jgi:hypothetical protein
MKTCKSATLKVREVNTLPHELLEDVPIVCRRHGRHKLDPFLLQGTALGRVLKKINPKTFKRTCKGDLEM